jgi:hypothetical protein
LGSKNDSKDGDDIGDSVFEFLIAHFQGIGYLFKIFGKGKISCHNRFGFRSYIKNKSPEICMFGSLSSFIKEVMLAFMQSGDVPFL